MADFKTTRPSMIERAQSLDPNQAREALCELCEYYYDDILAYMRRAFRDSAEAKDAAHDFLHGWLRREESPLKTYQHGDTKFRHWLKVCLKNFCNSRRRLPPRLEAKEPGFADPDVELDRGIAHTVARHVVQNLREEWLAGPAPRRGAFLEVAAIVFLEDETPYADLARQHEVPPSTVRGWVLSMRKDYGRLFREELRQQCRPEDLAEEFRIMLELAWYQEDGSKFFPTLPALQRCHS
jgi:DNA-directed RNA polymerase specialized sigma24 family protein